MNYIRIRKLQHSILSLLNGEKVIDVAFKYGFESHEGFTRSFTKFEYDQTVDFSSLELQTMSSLCENLSISVYKMNRCFKQDFIKGIAQHEIYEGVIEENRTGMELSLIPDKDIFGEIEFSKDRIQSWMEEKLRGVKNIVTYIPNTVTGDGEEIDIHININK